MFFSSNKHIPDGILFFFHIVYSINLRMILFYVWYFFFQQGIVSGIGGTKIDYTEKYVHPFADFAKLAINTLQNFAEYTLCYMNWVLFLCM